MVYKQIGPQFTRNDFFYGDGEMLAALGLKYYFYTKTRSSATRIY